MLKSDSQIQPERNKQLKCRGISKKWCKMPRKILRVLLLLVFPTMLFSYEYFPVNLGDVWYYKGYKKADKTNIFDIKAEVKTIEVIDGKAYYYYSAPAANVRFLIRTDEAGAYLRVLRFPYPILDFLSIDIDIKPEVQFLRFPFVVGDSWSMTATARAEFFKFEIIKHLTTTFTVLANENLKIGNTEIDTFHIRNSINQGDGTPPVIEDHWHGKGVGYTQSDTPEYFLTLDRYEPAPAPLAP